MSITKITKRNTKDYFFFKNIYGRMDNGEECINCTLKSILKNSNTILLLEECVSKSSEDEFNSIELYDHIPNNWKHIKDMKIHSTYLEDKKISCILNTNILFFEFEDFSDLEDFEKQIKGKYEIYTTMKEDESMVININIELSNILKNELDNSEIGELKRILDSSDDKQKGGKFTEKLKSFGTDVASNILFNILSNSNIYEQLIKNI